MSVPIPFLEPIDQTTDTIIVRNLIPGAMLHVSVNSKTLIRTSAWQMIGDEVTARDLSPLGARVPLPRKLSPGDQLRAIQIVATGTSDESPLRTVEYAVTTNHYDNARTGWNPNESRLTVAALKPADGTETKFGKLFRHAIDGQAYAQPLYVSNLALPGKGTHNVIFVATENATVYAFDADSNDGINATPLLQRSLLNGLERPLTVGDVGDCPNISPVIGITGTPVIDVASQTLYVVVKSVALKPTTLIDDNLGTVYQQRLHALDLATLQDRPHSPVLIEASMTNPETGNSVCFDSRYQNQRAGLLLNRGTLYIAWAAHCDQGEYYGWILAYDATSLLQTAVFNAIFAGAADTRPPVLVETIGDANRRGHDGAGIWQGGIGLACDADGYVYCVTGNGSFRGGMGVGFGYGNSVLKLDSSLQLVDFFTPFNVANLDPLDLDLGSGAPILIPAHEGGPALPLLLVCGKEGKIYVLNRLHLGGFTKVLGAASDANIVQTVFLYPGRTPPGPAQPTGTDSHQPGVWGGPACATLGQEQFVYYCGNYGTGPGGSLKAFLLRRPFRLVAGGEGVLEEALLPGGVLNQSADPAGSTVDRLFPPINAGGATPVVSSNGSQADTGIVWAIRRVNPLRLMAFNATDLTQSLLEDGNVAGLEAGPWNNSQGAPMIEPTVINGKVYVGSDGELNVFGLAG